MLELGLSVNGEVFLSFILKKKKKKKKKRKKKRDFKRILQF